VRVRFSCIFFCLLRQESRTIFQTVWYSPSAAFSNERPTATGTYNYTVTITDAKGHQGTVCCSITVYPSISSSCSFVTISATHGVAITPVTVTASGGAGGPYTFTATGLPAGLSISTGGTISGTPTTAGIYSYTITITDKNGNKGTLNCSTAAAERSGAPVFECSERGGVHIRRGRLFDFHVPVATFSQLATDVPLTGAVVEIPITPTNQQVPTLEGRTEHEIAREFQNKLFGFRVDWLSKVNVCTFDAPQLASPMRQVARSFGACVPDDPGLQSGLIASLEAIDQSDRLERSTSLQASVIEALLFFVHAEERRDSVHVGRSRRS
jgi:hypothetical protein